MENVYTVWYRINSRNSLAIVKSNRLFSIIQLLFVVIILFYYIYYSIVSPDPYGLGDALRLTIGLIIFTIIGFIVKYFLDKKLYWKFFIPVLIIFIPLLLLILRKLLL